MITAKSVSVIGLDPAELRWVGMLLGLLRHPDSDTAELVRRALVYLNETAPNATAAPAVAPFDNAS